MKIAVEGCAHGELEKIYDTIQGIEKAENIKIDLLLCCGDFQSTRNLEDLQTMAVPPKYLDMCTFYKYYSGERVAPLLTIFIGGNHEASNYLQELPYGGWVAPNIYYLGYAGVVRVNGIRIAGLSGIYKGHDFLRGRHEFPPYTESTRKSVYHVRQLEVFRLKQLSGAVDICISHDWPRGIYNYGNKAQLVRFKPHFRDEVQSNQLGSRPCEELLKALKPALWFAAHLHCKFAAVVPHGDADNDNVGKQTTSVPFTPDKDIGERIQALPQPEGRVTKFLALDKCLPRRRFLQVLDYDSAEYTDDGQLRFEYDLEWLTILYLTNHLINVKNGSYYMPGPRSGMTTERYNFTPTPEELQYTRQKFSGDLKIPNNFCRTVEPYNPNETGGANVHPPQPNAIINAQSMHFCDTLGIDDPLSLAMLISGHELSHSSTLDGSDAILSDSSLLLGEQSDLDSSSLVDTSTQNTTPLKRKSNLSLSLPKPTSNPTDRDCSMQEPALNPDELYLSDNSANEAEAAIADQDELANTATQTTDDKNIQEPNAEAALPASDGINSKPPIKKFKRRNQDIYQEESEDI